jgi:lipoic acid synthetase
MNTGIKDESMSLVIAKEAGSCLRSSECPELPKTRKPPWIRVRMPAGRQYEHIKGLMRSKSLDTVCEEARCPNIAECWGCGTATFLILGSICTRSCAFCAVRSGRPEPNATDSRRANAVAEAAAAMKLRHAVITSVTRDDLADGGAALFAATINRIQETVAGCSVEVLIPDFEGKRESLRMVVEARPDIIGHNIETVPRLYPQVRPQAIYERSLHVLRAAKGLSPDILTKSGIMVGLGEDWDELQAVMDDLRTVECDILTIGQYLRPTELHHAVIRYYNPDELEALKRIGQSKGFRWIEAGPLVRSSYHAEAQARELRV